MCSGPSTTITMGAQRCKGHSQQGCHHHQLAGGDSCARLQGRAAQHGWSAGLGLISPLAPLPCVAAQENGASSKAYFYKVMYTCAQIGRPPREGTAGDQWQRPARSIRGYAACSACSKARRRASCYIPAHVLSLLQPRPAPLPQTQTSNPNPRIIWRLHRSQDGQPLCLPASCFQRRLRGAHHFNGAVVHRDQLQERPCQHVLPEHSPEHYVVRHCTVRTNASDS